MANCAYYTRQITVHETSVAILCALFYNTLADDALFFRSSGRSVPDQSFIQTSSFLAFARGNFFYFEDRVMMMNASDLVNSEKHE